MNEFINALKKNDKDKIKSLPKADLHNHAVFSCSRDYLIKNNVIIPKSESVTDISTLISFARCYIKPLQNNIDGLILLLNGTFINCLSSGVTIVDTNIDYKICLQLFNGNINDFILLLNSFEFENLTIRWIIDISRDSYKDEHEMTIINLIKSKFFYGIDLTSTENIVKNEKFINIYNVANSFNLKTKVHCGEQLGAEYIRQCIDDFNPKQIQHGINIVKDKSVMQLAKKKGIVFNVCPTSNLVLNYVSSISKHPIKQMVAFGLNVTIGTDDMLFFNSDINDEYLELYKQGVLSAEQLETIRNFSLTL